MKCPYRAALGAHGGSERLFPSRTRTKAGEPQREGCSEARVAHSPGLPAAPAAEPMTPPWLEPGDQVWLLQPGRSWVPGSHL